MRWSIKSLLLYTVAFAKCLTVSRLPYMLGGLALIVVLYALRIVLPGAVYARVSHGASLGIVASFALTALCAGIVDAASAYTERELSKIVYPWLPYIVQLGAFAGGSVGLLYHKLKPIRTPRIIDDRVLDTSEAIQ